MKFSDYGPGLVMLLVLGLFMYLLGREETLVSPSQHATILLNGGKPSSCVLDVGEGRTSNQIWTDMTWCMDTVRAARRTQGLP
jgi:hypothetical protein